MFERAVEVVLKHEGGYVWHPKDPGGETNWGISKRAFPHLDIKNLTKAQAVHIYFENYWAPFGIDQLPAPLQLMVFDTAVNMGPQRAVGFLQAVVGVKVDGDMGPVTLAKVNEFDPMDILRKYAVRRLDAYLDLPTFRTFGRGWMRRLLDVFIECTTSVEVFRG